MRLVDVNVLVYAFREDAPNHRAYKSWLDDLVAGDTAYGSSDLISSGFTRIVTHPRIFDPPTPVGDALGFCEAFRQHPNAVPIAPGPRHWDIFTDLCGRAAVKGGLVADAYLAAMAIESGSDFVSADRDFARFRGLRWQHPLEG